MAHGWGIRNDLKSNVSSRLLNSSSTCWKECRGWWRLNPALGSLLGKSLAKLVVSLLSRFLACLHLDRKLTNTSQQYWVTFEGNIIHVRLVPKIQVQNKWNMLDRQHALHARLVRYHACFLNILDIPWIPCFSSIFLDDPSIHVSPVVVLATEHLQLTALVTNCTKIGNFLTFISMSCALCHLGKNTSSLMACPFFSLSSA